LSVPDSGGYAVSAASRSPTTGTSSLPSISLGTTCQK
jgi:hypothetical protein